MNKPVPFKTWFWLIQPALFLLSAYYLSVEISTTPRSPFATPTFRFTFQVLQFWGGIVKPPVMIGQFLIVRSAFWLRCNGLIRGLLMYFLDLLISIIAVALLLQVWINTLFIDAGFPALMILFPYNILTGLMAAMLSPAPIAKLTATAQQPVEAVDPRLASLVTTLLFIIAFVATLLISTSTASNNFDLLGQTLAFFPLNLLVFRLYFIPTLSALHRAPNKTLKILLVNLVLGWTLVGWGACLLWAKRSIRTCHPVKKPFTWKSPAGWLITGFGMMLTGVGISVLGGKLREIMESQTGSIAAPVILLFISLAVTAAGIRIRSRINTAGTSEQQA